MHPTVEPFSDDAGAGSPQHTIIPSVALHLVAEHLERLNPAVKLE